MGLLADIYSAGDGLKRKVGGLLSDPMGTIDLGISRLKEDNNNALNLFSNAFPMAGEKTVLNSPEQIAQLQKQAAEYASQVGMAAATVWHGSPHKFDKFDSSKIGTGEGAQAYGHGLYLAENKNIAQGYADVVGRQHNQKWLYGDDKVSKPGDAGSRWALAGIDWLKKTNGDKDAAISAIKRNWEEGGYSTKGKDFRELKKWVIDADFAKIAPDNNLYKVDLPDEHIAKMLDWDKPLSQQSKEVQAAFQSPEVQSMVQSLKQKGVMGDYSADELAKFKGEDWHDFIRQASSDSNVAPSEFLKQRGVPGIRYLDGGSRGTGAGTSNFVVFPGNEGLLSILERNGQPIGGR